MAQNHFPTQYHPESISPWLRNGLPPGNCFSHSGMLETHHGHPHLLSNQCFLEEGESDLNVDGGSYLLNTPTAIPRSQVEWTEPHQLDYGYTDYYGLAASNVEDPQDGFSSRGTFDDTACPRTWAHPYELRPSWPFHMDNSAASQYQVHPPRGDRMEAPVNSYAVSCMTGENIQDIAQRTISSSPTMGRPMLTSSPDNIPNLVDAPSSKVSEYGDDEGAEGSQSAPEERISDEPYAKLIYRALLGARDHRMALQEIYQWFMENTDKGSLSTAGWRNSIRHNLSMNAAFRKTDRYPTGDDAKKSSEWVLEPFAIKNGVTPTTRYRKSGKKAAKSDNPDPVRVNSGRKGGQQAGKTKSLKQRPGDDHYDAPRGPARESRRRRSQARQHTAPATHLGQFSPSTPTAQEMRNHGPYYPGFMSHDGLPSLSDVNGVFIGDEPLFCPREHLPFGDHYPNTWANPH